MEQIERTQWELAVANSGGEFRVERSNSWVGTSIRKDKKLGKVIEDWNGAFRRLVVLFGDESKEEILMNNIGEDPRTVHKYEWLSNGKWNRF